MSRRIEIELTSKRNDGTWTWRAAGAREPKGVVADSLVPGTASVSDVVRAEVESDLDGTRVLSIATTKTKTERSNVLQLIPNEKPFEGVTSQLRKKDRDNKGPRRDKNRDKKGGSSDRPSRPRFETPPELPMRPKPKRLKAGRKNVDEVLVALPEAQRTIAEKVLQGGIPAVRAAVEEQNKQAVSEGKEKIPADGLVVMAEQLLPKLRVAEWLDRAMAAERIITEIDLRDLRSVVVSADDPAIARDESTRTLAATMKKALIDRQKTELDNWFQDIRSAVEVGRTVRALKLSSQPPKAGVPFPPDLALQLAAATSASLTADAPPERWITVLEAAAFSPVRAQVIPPHPAATVSADLTKTVQRLGVLMPQIAALYGIEVDPKSPAPRPLRPQRDPKDKKGREQRDKKPESKGDKPRSSPKGKTAPKKETTDVAVQPETETETVAPAQPEAVAPAQPEAVTPAQPDEVTPKTQTETDQSGTDTVSS
jgi:hypothetical protein